MKTIAHINWDRVGLGERPDVEIASELGVCPTTVGKHRKDRGLRPAGEIDWNSVGLGTVDDHTLAARLGVSVAVVGKHRRRRGIAMFRRHSKTATINWDRVGLGSTYDKLIADELGLCSSSVRRERIRRGIQPFKTTKGKISETSGMSRGFYWLGLFHRTSLDVPCQVPNCLADASAVGAFCLRGHVLDFKLCSRHGQQMQTWSLDKTTSFSGGELVAALRGPTLGVLRGHHSGDAGIV